MALVFPPDTIKQGDFNHISYHNNMADIFHLMADPNPRMAGADNTGGTDVSTAVNNVLANTGIAILTPGTYLVNSPIAMNIAGMAIFAAWPGKVTFIPGSGLSGQAVVNITADHCSVKGVGFQPATSTVNSNVVASGISVVGAQHVRLEDLWFQYINGYCINSVGGASSANLDLMIRSIIGRTCAGGIHLQGVTGSSFGGEHFLTDIQLQRIGAGTSVLDALLVEDVSDVTIQGYNGSVLGGSATNKTFHVKGLCSSVFGTNLDIGMITRGTAAPTAHYESSSNGSPTGCGLTSGIIQAGNDGVQIDAGVDIGLHNMKIKNNSRHGANITGGDQVVFDSGSNFATNNQAGNTVGNDVSISASSGLFYFRGDILASPVNTTPTAGFVTNPVNDVNHRGVFEHDSFSGSGNTPSTVFSGTPQIVRQCIGYSPRGQITAPTITTGTFTTSTSQHDVLIIFLTVGGMTAFKINGVSVGGVPVVGVPYRIPARQALEVDSATTAPTWAWFAE